MNYLAALVKQLWFFQVCPSSKISTEAGFAIFETEEHFGLNYEDRPAHLDQINEMGS